MAKNKPLVAELYKIYLSRIRQFAEIRGPQNNTPLNNGTLAMEFPK